MLWQMVLQKYGITFAVGSVPVGVIILFFLWAFWAGEEGGGGVREGREREKERGRGGENRTIMMLWEGGEIY